MKLSLLYVILLMGYGCTGCQSLPATNQSTTAKSSDRCPDKPVHVLEQKNVKELTFTNNTSSTSGQLRSGENLGYKFKGEVGKTLNFQTKEDICLWVYTPENIILTDLKFPDTGQYVIQVAARQGTQTFNLELNIKDPNQPSSPSPSSPSASRASPSSSQSATKVPQTFKQSDFPKALCGDSRPNDLSAYPLDFYPVNVPNTNANLVKAQSRFCTDTYIKRSKDTGERIIQVASFINQQDAKNFADMVSTEISGAVVGTPTTVQRPTN